MEKILTRLPAIAIFCTLTLPLAGALIGVNPGFPKLAYNSVNSFALNYISSNQLFSVSSPPNSIQFSTTEGPRPVTGVRSLEIRALVDSAGALVSGVPGDDFVLSGNVVRIVSGVTNIYTGVLLTGEVVDFGFQNTGLSTDEYDLRFQVTGGQMAALFGANLGVSVTSDGSTFAGSFETNFNGRARGNAGPEDLDNTPPVITCPPNIVVECNTNLNGVGGVYVTYPDPVTDDPAATITCTPTNGSFFALPAGLSSTNHTVVCVATDLFGNSSECSFLITVQDTMPPEFADTNNPVINGCAEPIVVANDLGQCWATFSFLRPFAIDSCNGEEIPIPANASAIDEHGMVIPLIDIGGGVLQGTFPQGTNVITFTADDGRGNSAQAQCTVVVVDAEAPTMICTDQTGTFKPVFTNALSCIAGEFGCRTISSNQTIWFSSVVNTPSNPKEPFSVRFFDQRIELSVCNSNLVIRVPDSIVYFSNGVAVATTTFTNGQWVTVAKTGHRENAFLSGVAFDVPFDLQACQSSGGRPRCMRGNSRHADYRATWCGRFEVSRPHVVLKWAWSAAAYTQFSTDYAQLGVKPIDSPTGSAYSNYNYAGTPENFKQYVTPDAHGDGRQHRGGTQGDRYTGELTHFYKPNLGVGTVCMGAVDFDPPVVADNCVGPITVVSTPPSGSLFGPGDHVITSTATDSSGNSNTCSFTLTVLSPLQVVFDAPCNDNHNDNSCHPDAGWSSMNCPDDPSTPQCVTKFWPCENILHTVRLLDCNGNDVTCEVAPFVTVHIDVTLRQGTYSSSVILQDLAENYAGTGSPGGIMVPHGGQFKYVLETAGYPEDTLYNNSRFFRSCVWVDYNSSPGIPVGMEDVILESK